jgi:hypothetical protein
MQATVLDHARNRIQVISNLIFLLASNDSLPAEIRSYVTQAQSELMLLAQLLSRKVPYGPIPRLPAHAAIQGDTLS